MTEIRSKTETMLIAALVEICRAAPALSEEAEEINVADPHGARCVWLMKYRDLQRIARRSLLDLGIEE
ncbi:hypothetical protein [Roseovarius sp. MBR-6]|jgi:hypothetical protein|uniref:hypothetical protein n=1 Tax=Roseovarius sp. MBR-6 TaxID=3156459 RepID=UPI00339A8CC7